MPTLGKAFLRHASHYLKVLMEADEQYYRGGDALKRGLALFDISWTNIRAGQLWATEHASEDHSALVLCSDYAGGGVRVMALRQRPLERIRWLEAALLAAQRLCDSEAEGRHTGNLGLGFAKLGQMRFAIECFQQALAIARNNQNRQAESEVLCNLGLAHTHLGKLRDATDFYEQALAIARETKDRRGEGIALGIWVQFMTT